LAERKNFTDDVNSLLPNDNDQLLRNVLISITFIINVEVLQQGTPFLYALVAHRVRQILCPFFVLRVLMTSLVRATASCELHGILRGGQNEILAIKILPCLVFWHPPQ
jgi:hypothetical protein